MTDSVRGNRAASSGTSSGETTQVSTKPATAETTQFNLKSGKGLRAGVVSELTAFFGVLPGHADELRAASQRFGAMLQNNPPELNEKTGLRYARFVVFDGGKRLAFITGFESDWDPYVEDAVALIGFNHFVDWLQHTTSYEQIEKIRQASGPTGKGNVPVASGMLKQLLMDAQTPAAAYFDALGDWTVPQIRRALKVNEAFQQVLDNPAAAGALQNPALKPLADLAAD